MTTFSSEKQTSTWATTGHSQNPMIGPLPSRFPVAGVAVISLQSTTFNYIKIWEPVGFPRLRLRTGAIGRPTEPVQPCQLFQMQSLCQCSTHSSTTHPTSLLFQRLFSILSLQPSSHSETATGPTVSPTSLTATTARQDTGSLSLSFALISVRTIKCPAKKQNPLVILFAAEELDNTRSGEFGVKE